MRTPLGLPATVPGEYRSGRPPQLAVLLVVPSGFDQINGRSLVAVSSSSA